MKTKTHYLYGFIIVSLVIALVIASVSKPTPKTIEITPPVERTTEMVTLPPSDTDDDTDDSTEKIYDDNYYTAAIYHFYCFWCFLVALILFVTVFDRDEVKKENYRKTLFPVAFIMIWLFTLSFVFAVVSLSVDTLHGYQKILMILFTLFIPISMIIGGVLFAITPPPPDN